jgi:hypothetical protein
MNGEAMQLGSLGAVVGIGAAVLTPGSDMRKLSQIGGLTAAGVGLGMLLDPDDSSTLLGGALAATGLLVAVFGGV